MLELAVKGNIVELPRGPSLQSRGGGGLKVAHLEEGYSRIANSLLENICRLDITARQYKVLLAIVRKTYGYNKKSDWITASQVADVMGYESDTSNIRRDIRDLKSRKIVFSDGQKIGINKAFGEWIFCSEGGSKTTRNRVEKNPPNNVSRRVNSDPWGGQKQSVGGSKTTRLAGQFQPLQKTKDNITKDKTLKKYIKKDRVDWVNKPPLETPRKIRAKKPDVFKDFFAQYPAHRKGGCDKFAWGVWQSEKLTEQDAHNASAWLNIAANNNPDWKTQGSGQFVFGITKFIRERIWLTPVPKPETPKRPEINNHDKSWIHDMGDLL